MSTPEPDPLIKALLERALRNLAAPAPADVVPQEEEEDDGCSPELRAMLGRARLIPNRVVPRDIVPPTEQELLHRIFPELEEEAE